MSPRQRRSPWRGGSSALLAHGAPLLLAAGGSQGLYDIGIDGTCSAGSSGGRCPGGASDLADLADLAAALSASVVDDDGAATGAGAEGGEGAVWLLQRRSDTLALRASAAAAEADPAAEPAAPSETTGRGTAPQVAPAQATSAGEQEPLASVAATTPPPLAPTTTAAPQLRPLCATTLAPFARARAPFFDVLGAAAASPPPEAWAAGGVGGKLLGGVAGAYAIVLAAIPYGLLIVVGGLGSAQVLATLAFWLLVRPAASALEALFLAASGCPGAPHPIAAAYPMAAHFYWAWLLLETATRRKAPLSARLGALAALSLALLPVPAAQVLLGDRTPLQAAAGAAVGHALGFGFFFGIRASGVYAHLAVYAPPPVLLRKSANPAATAAAVASAAAAAATKKKRTLGAFWLRPRDNLTNAWGGSSWPLQLWDWDSPGGVESGQAYSSEQSADEKADAGLHGDAWATFSK